MGKLLTAFIEICLLRRAPQDVPASGFLLALSLLLYALVGLALSAQSLNPGPAMTLTVIDAGLLAGLLWVLLWIKDLLNRYQQSLTALFGAGAVMQVIALPLVLMQPESVTPETMSPGVAMVSLLLWLWLFWNLVIIGHVLRHAISTVLPVGMILALFYVFVSFSVTRSLFFSPATG